MDTLIPIVQQELKGRCRGMGASAIWRLVKVEHKIKVKRFVTLQSINKIRKSVAGGNVSIKQMK